jgi:hypothetical protein
MEHISPNYVAALQCIQNPWYSYDIAHGISLNSPVIQLAYEIAEKAHRNDVREKKIGTIPYITHPIMLCKLLEAMGHGDEFNLAIALLHDVLEDCEPYCSSPRKLQEDLFQGLKKAGYDDRGAVNISSYIFEHCKELCNDQVMEEGKRTFQVMHAHAMTDRSKLIKILDQTASVMDDIFLESARPKDKIERFAMKGLNVVKAAARGGTPEINAAANIFSVFFKKLRGVSAQVTSSDADFVRTEFNPYRLIDEVLEHSIRPSKPYQEVVYWNGQNRDKSAPMPLSGCVALYLTKSEDNQLRISGYDCLIDRVVENFSAANHATWYLLGKLESFKEDTHVDIGQARIESGQLARHYTITPPISPRKFAAAARSAEQQVQASASENGVHADTIPTAPVLGMSLALQLQRIEKDLSASTFIG